MGILGPIGKPVRSADWYVMGCDETGLPALRRILETLPETMRGSTFGWFAGEAEQTERVRNHWRGTLGLSRESTLAATYWKRGATGLMAG